MLIQGNPFGGEEIWLFFRVKYTRETIFLDQVNQDKHFFWVIISMGYLLTVALQFFLNIVSMKSEM